MQDKRMKLLPGTVLHFPGMDCVIETCIGAGSNAIAYRGFYYDAQFRELKHQVIIKELFPFDPEEKIRRAENSQEILIDEAAADQMEFQKKSFQRGNRIHVKVLADYPSELDANFNTYALNGTLYSVLGFSGGKTLDDKTNIVAVGKQSLKKKVQRTVEILDALACFHQEELLHLDISPDNILLVGEGPRERISIIDYNSVHSIREFREDPASCYLSQKPGFTAPELLSGRVDQIGYAADLYSVAAIFYWMLTGQRRTMTQVLQKKFPGLSFLDGEKDLQETVKSQICLIIKKGLTFSPTSRYQSVSDMRMDLAELIDRIDGRGITHAAIWETGRTITGKILNRNTSFAYIRDEEKRFPAVVDMQGQAGKSLVEFSEWLLSEKGRNCFLFGDAGIGKTSTLLTLAYLQPKKYTREQTAFIYLSLFDMRQTEHLDLIGQILYKLKFKPDCTGMDDARRELESFLSEPVYCRSGKRPKLVLLLDGVNEYSGDRDELRAEIERLAAYEGVRILAAGRTFPKDAHLVPCIVRPLADREILRILQDRGIHAPRAKEMLAELRIPLLLSIYIQTMENSSNDEHADTTSELLACYLKSILEKSSERNTEDGSVYWQLRIAVYYILPEIALRINRTNHSVSDNELLSVVENCYRKIGSRKFRKVFPDCIGHSADILAGAATAEEWYGIIVQRILWKHLGILVRDDDKTYRVFHQSMEEYLLTIRFLYGGKIEKADRRQKLISISAGAAALLASVFGIVYVSMPKIYNEHLAEQVVDTAYYAYNEHSNQYVAFNEFLDTVSESVQVGSLASLLNSNSGQQTESSEAEKTSAQENVQETLCIGQTIVTEGAAQIMADNLMGTGKIMPWSEQPLDSEDYVGMVEFSNECVNRYSLLLTGLCKMLEDEESFERASTTKEDCIRLIQEYMENDRIIADCYYYRVLDQELQNFDQQKSDEYIGGLTIQPIDEEDIDLDNIEGYLRYQNELWDDLAYVSSKGTGIENNTSDQGTDNESSDTETDLGQQANEKLETAFSEYLTYLESCLSTEDWVYGYVEEFLTDPTWENLYLARSACIIAAGEIDALQIPSVVFTDEEFAYLATDGVDMASIMRDFYNIEEQKDTSHQAIRDQLLYDLEMNFYNNDSIEFLSNWVGLQKQNNNLLSQYYIAWFYYMFLCQNDSVSAANISELESLYPYLTENASWYQTKEDAMNAAGTLFSQYGEANAMVYNLSVLTANFGESLYDIANTMEGVNQEDVAATVFNIADAPEYLPIPDWYYTDNTGYCCFYQKADGDIVYPTSRDDLSGYIDYEDYGVYMQTSDVEESQFTEYISYLTECGYTVDDLEENDYIISMDDYSVEMIYEGGTVTVVFLGTDITFVPEYLF